MKILLGLGAVAGLLFLGAIWVFSGAPLPTIPPARTAAPEGFDMAIYPKLSALAPTERANVVNLNTYGEPFEHYLLPDLLVTCFTLFTEEEQTRTMCIDRDGAVISDITDQPEIFPMGPFLVTPDAYYTITATSISKPRPMQVFGPVPLADLERLIEESTLYRSFTSSDLAADDAGRSAGRSVHVMHHDGVWKRIAADDQPSHQWKTGPFHDLEAVLEISRPSPSGDADNFFGSRYRLELTHFDQQEFLPHRSAPMGSTTGQGRPAQWVGTGYYTVFIDNAPALRFRIENDSENLSDFGPVRLVAEGGAMLGFLSITHTDKKGMKDMIVVSDINQARP